MKSDEQAAFVWDLKGRVVVIDNGGSFVRKRVFNKMASLKSLATIMFDPSGKHQDEASLTEIDEFQMFPHATLGDGKDVTMHACLKEGNSATLEPHPEACISEDEAFNYKVLAKFPISSIALDAIEGLPSVDFLVLDEKHDNISILECGKRTLKDTLLVQVRVPFNSLYHGSSDIPESVKPAPTLSLSPPASTF